jgi:hypothetical protein
MLFFRGRRKRFDFTFCPAMVIAPIQPLFLTLPPLSASTTRTVGWKAGLQGIPAWGFIRLASLTPHLLRHMGNKSPRDDSALLK